MINLALLKHFARRLAHTPSTGIFLGFGWMLSALLTLTYGDFLLANHAGLELTYGFLPWVMCLLIPALTMQVADENARGVQERLETLPFTPGQLILSRFAVHWLLIGLWLLGLWPMVATVAYLGNPDYGPILSGLLGAWLLAAPLLAASLFVMRMASNSVTGFLMAFGACIALTHAGAPQTVGWLVTSVPSFVVTPLIHTLQNATLFSATMQLIGGYVPLGALAVFAAFTLFFLGLSHPDKLRRAACLGVAVALYATAFVTPLARLGVDTTADNLHSLSPATVNIIKNLPEPVTLTLYQSLNNPDIPPSVLQNAEALRKLLIGIKRVNPDKITLQAVNADASSHHALQALRAGVEEQVLPSGTGFFSGLVATNAQGRSSLIRALNPERRPFLEFDVMSLLTESQRTQKPVLTLITNLNTLNPTAVPRWLGEIGSTYTLTTLAESANEIPPETNLLLIVGNFALPEDKLETIRRYLENGGNAVWLADPLWRTAPKDLAVTSGNRTIAEFMGDYGLNVRQDAVVADTTLATPVAQEKTGFTAYPFWLSLTRANLNARLPFATFVDTLVLGEAGPISADNLRNGLTFTPIVTTTENGQLLPRTVFEDNPAELLASRLKGVETSEYVVAALVTGSFAGQGGKPSTLLVVNDIDWLANTFALRQVGLGGPGNPPEFVPINSNLVLFFNALQYTLGESALVELRGKATTRRTLTRVEALLAELTRNTVEVEQKLAAELYTVTERLAELEASMPQGADEATYSSVQRAEIQSYQQQQFELRQQLRELRSKTRNQLQGLQTSILLLNLLTMPVLLAIGLLIWRRRQPRS